MKSFAHVNAESVGHALRLLDRHRGKAVVMAGGTDLLTVLKDRILPFYPEMVINLKSIPGLDRMGKDPDGGFRIGALTWLADIAKSPEVIARFGALAAAAGAVGTPLIRKMGTLGGNLCQDVRCGYYRYPHHMGGRMICRRKGKGPCFAIKGDHRTHAIFGARGCYAVCPSDTAVALCALDAQVWIAGVRRNRGLSVSGFFTPMGNALGRSELVEEIRLPDPPEGSRQCFLKFAPRTAVDFALVSVACCVTIRDGVMSRARVALGGVAAVPLRAEKAEQVLEGRALDVAAAQEAAEASVSGARALTKTAYKIEITRQMVKRAILSLRHEESDSTKEM